MPITVGTASITFNDNTVQTSAPTAPTTAVVLNAIAGATAGAVGTYTTAIMAVNTNVSVGGTTAGSNLRVDSVNTLTNGVQVLGAPYNAGGTSLSGTWRKMGGPIVYQSYTCGCSGLTVNQWGMALWLRIS